MAVGYSHLKEKVKTAKKLGLRKVVGAHRWEQIIALDGNRFASISLSNSDIVNVDDLEVLHSALVEKVKTNHAEYSYKRFF